MGRVGPNRDEVCLCVSSKYKHLPSDLRDVTFYSLLSVLIESETIVYFFGINRIQIQGLSTAIQNRQADVCKTLCMCR